MFGQFPQMKNEDQEEDQIDHGYDVPYDMTLEQYVQISALHIQKKLKPHFSIIAVGDSNYS